MRKVSLKMSLKASPKTDFRQWTRSWSSMFADIQKSQRKKLASMLGCAPKTVKRHLAKLPNVRYVGHGYSGLWDVGEIKGG